MRMQLPQLLRAFALIALCATAAASGGRTVEDAYIIGASPCGLPVSPEQARHCFILMPGESRVSISLVEETPTRLTGLPVLAIVRYMGIPSFNYPFCGSGWIPIEPGATGIEVAVQQGERSGFCARNSNEISPAVKGTITVTFSS